MSQYMDYLSRRVGYQSYNKYLDSEHWKIFSDGMRDSKCFCCYHTGILHVHHIDYTNLGKELPTDVVTVCGNCHLEIHAMVSSGQKLRKAHISLRKRINNRKKNILSGKIFSSIRSIPEDVCYFIERVRAY